MAKKLKTIVRLQLTAGKANPAPPVGPALAGHGLNIMAFCKEYNARTSNRPGELIPAEISVFTDGSFTFILKTPPAAFLANRRSPARCAANRLPDRRGRQAGSSGPETGSVGQRKSNRRPMPGYNLERAETQIAPARSLAHPRLGPPERGVRLERNGRIRNRPAPAGGLDGAMDRPAAGKQGHQSTVSLPAPTIHAGQNRSPGPPVRLGARTVRDPA